MLIQSSLALLSLVPLVAGRPRQSPLRKVADDDCPKALIVGVRGTLEEPGFGAMKPIVDEVMTKIDGAEGYAVDYPASGITKTGENKFIIDPFIYSASKTRGGDVTRSLLEDFHDACPDTPVVLMGYSQGAHVVGDVVCGVLPGIWPIRDALSKEAKSNIKAIIQFGDPSNRRDLAWHKGTSQFGGIVPRAGIGACKDLGDRWQSYCDSGDFFCDRGKDVGPHLKYVENYKDEVVKFITDKLKSKSKSKSKSTAHFEIDFEI